MHFLDSYMPEYDRSARHATDVRAHAATVAASIWQTDLAGCEVVRVLLGRSCGSAFLESVGGLPARFTIGEFQALGCIVVTSPEGREVLLGAMGSLAASRFEFSPADVEGFTRGDHPDAARVLWHFNVVPQGRGRSVLSLETRLRCAGEAQRLLLRWDAFERMRARAWREVLLAVKALAETEPATPGGTVIWD